MLAGMFGGRILAGALADVAGWQGVLAVFAVLAVLTVPVLWWSVPPRPSAPARLDRPVRAALRLLAGNGRLRQHSLIQLFAFAGFTAMWTVIAMHLTDRSVGWSIAQANWFGLVGLAAGLASLPLTMGPLTRILTRGRPRQFGFVMLFLGTGVAIAQPRSIAALVVAMFAVTLANQLIHAVNQDSVMTLAPTDRAKANAAFMMMVFVGGAIGAGIGPVAYAAGGMRGTAAFAAATGALAALATASWWRRTRP
jgi:predicted MFS family arabinose efflux permease